MATAVATNGKKSIQIENVGPIQSLTIPLPEAGVVVLHGRNGSGKSHAIAAVDSLVSGRGKPPCRDGMARGFVEGCGARLTIGRSARRTGEAEVHTLEGRLDISQLVQPPIKDEDAADRQRIKALIQLAGVEADPAVYREILPEGTDMAELLGTEGQTGDAVNVAGKLKRALEAEARRQEKVAEAARLKALSIRERAGEIDSDAPEQEAAETALQAALVAEERLRTTAAQVAERRIAARKAREALEVARERGAMPGALETDVAEARETVERLDREAIAARERLRGLERSLAEARRHREEIAMLEKALENVPEPIAREAIGEAASTVAEARIAHTRAVEAAAGRRLLSQAEEVMEGVNAAERAAQRFREAAGGVDAVLSDMVAKVTTRLRVEAGRLVCDTDRGSELLSDLSGGERWRLALEIAAEQVGQGGLVTVPQEAWEGLDPQNRAEVAGIARRVGVVLLTAECGEQAEIAAEVVS